MIGLLTAINRTIMQTNNNLQLLFSDHNVINADPARYKLKYSLSILQVFKMLMYFANCLMFIKNYSNFYHRPAEGARSRLLK